MHSEMKLRAYLLTRMEDKSSFTDQKGNKDDKRVLTDRFMLGLTLICRHNRLIMMMSPHKHVTPV